MRRPTVLLSAPTFMNIYKDIVECLESKGFDVTWVSSEQPEADNPFTPIFTHCYNNEQIALYLNQVETIWSDFFKNDETDFYDYFLAIDGLMVCPGLFNELRKKNSKIRCVLFLYDKIDIACKVDRFFKYYDDVFSFDLGDSEKYDINFLPIYWVPSKQTLENKYDIFGFGSYNIHKPNRTILFKNLIQMSNKNGYHCYIKLYCSVAGSLISILKNFIFLFFKRQYYIPLNDLFSKLVVGKPILPDDFRNYISRSKAVLDTQAPYQDGMTARFMWALGLGKKIITTNAAISRYPFYNPNQFFILNNNINEIPDFMSKDFALTEENRKIIDCYRIDNWISTLLAL